MCLILTGRACSGELPDVFGSEAGGVWESGWSKSPLPCAPPLIIC